MPGLTTGVKGISTRHKTNTPVFSRPSSPLTRWEDSLSDRNIDVIVFLRFGTIREQPVARYILCSSRNGQELFPVGYIGEWNVER